MLMDRAISLADYVSYRDVVSREYMESHGFDTIGHHVYPDLVFGFPQEQMPTHEPPTWPPKTIGVGVMAYDGYGRNNAAATGQPIYRDYLDKLKTFVGWLLARGYAVRLLTGEAGDARPVRQLLDSLPDQGKATRENITWHPIRSHGELLRQIALTDLVVATRYHNLIFSLVLNRPAISISYHKKNDEVLRGAGLGDYCQPIDTLDVELLIRQFQNLVAHPQDLISQIGASNSIRRQLLGEQYSILFGNDKPSRERSFSYGSQESGSRQ